MEFNRDWIGVNFLDRLLRVYLNYSFVEVEPGRMFLTMSTYREFEGLSDNVKNGTTYIFKQDGLVLLREQDVTNKVLRTSKRMADVSGNWDKYPNFGEYESLLRLERSTKPLE